jgi:hypothetical protein
MPAVFLNKSFGLQQPGFLCNVYKYGWYLMLYEDYVTSGVVVF